MYFIDQCWLTFVATMALLGVVGFYMLEVTQIRIKNNENLRLKIPCIMAVQAITYFLVGIGFSVG
jgi:ammonia channel protein AmtB